MRVLALLAAAAAAIAVPASALAKAMVFFEDTVPAGKSSSVTITTHRTASFRVVLRVPTQGRAQLILAGKSVGSKLLIDNKSYKCEGAAGSAYCRGAYEPLPKGTYTWRVRWLGKQPAHFELTVRW
ncbi:MAG: hypothetical protein H0U08_09995 [Actinobacteria bacterium]|nr:hypothetical protein [Actinomycetota bacterium]